jgi:hypothetical protein
MYELVGHIGVLIHVTHLLSVGLMDESSQRACGTPAERQTRACARMGRTRSALMITLR